jgi:ATP-dependent Lon protease
VSELAGYPPDPSVVMTGKTDIKGRVGPVGGLDWRGAGKIIAAIKTKRIKVKKFIMPKWNYERARDEIKVLEDSGITVVPVEKQVEAWVHSLNMDEAVLLERLATNLEHVDAFTNRYSSYLKKNQTSIPNSKASLNT